MTSLLVLVILVCVCTAMSLKSSQAFPGDRRGSAGGEGGAVQEGGGGGGGGGEREGGGEEGPRREAPAAGPSTRTPPGSAVSSASERWPRPSSLPTWLQDTSDTVPEERQQRRVVKCILSGFSETGRATVFQKVKTSFQVRLMKNRKNLLEEWHTGCFPVVLPPRRNSSKSQSGGGAPWTLLA